MRDLDWEVVACKIVLLDKNGVTSRFNRATTTNRQNDPPHWIPAYADMQKLIGVFPLSVDEGEKVRFLILDIKEGVRQ